MNVLLSIKPKYVEEIKTGNKKYEYRKLIWNNQNIDKIYIYSSAPIKRIIGSFTIGDIIEDNPKNLWQKFKDFSGMNEMEFFSYFNNHKKGFAIRIENIEILEKPIDPFKEFLDFKPPQSFYYFSENLTS